jgi:hypothetical protein
MGRFPSGHRMRIWLVTVALLFAGLPAFAADLRPPENLPQYDFAIHLDLAGQKAHVTQNVVWVNKTTKPAEQLVFNVHSHFTPPETAKEIDQFARLLEIFRMPFREAIYHKNAFDLHKVERLRKVGNDWLRDELKTQWNKDLKTALIVALPEAVPPGGSVAVSLSYTIELPQKQGRWGQWKGVITLSNWHPVVAIFDAEKGWMPTPFIPWHQPWFNEAGVYTAAVRLPKDEQVACTGSIAKVEESGATKDVSIGPVTARDFSLITSSRFQEFSTEAVNAGAGKVKVKCLAFPEHEFYARALIKHAARAIEAYSKWLGPYPYPEFTIAESYFGWNGNELCGMVMIDERVFGMPHLAEGYVQYLISHETCHQWFYNVIGTDGYRETFMDEAIVVHLSHRLLDELEGKNNDLFHYPPWLAWLPGIQRENYRYSQFYSTLKNGDLKPAVGELQTYGQVINLFSAVYDRGGKIVGMIQERLGPTAFLEFLRRIYGKYYFRIIRVADLQRELEEYTGQKWDVFFKDWFTTNGMSDWAIDGVKLNGNTASVTLSQRAEISEDTTLGFSFDHGLSYPIRVPVKAPRRSKPGVGNVAGSDPAQSDLEIRPLPGEFASTLPIGVREGSTFGSLIAPPLSEGEPPLAHPAPNPVLPVEHLFGSTASPQPGEWLDDTRIRIDVTLPAAPNQIAVDPDQLLPDADPANNFWHLPIRWRPRPLYSFIDDPAFTNDYDKWNVIFGPWVYADPHFESWYTRMSVLGARIGVNRLEEFRGGVYVGYRPTFGDIAVGADGVISHFPWPKSELGFNVEKSVAAFINESDEYRPDRAVVYIRHNIEATSSLYWLPREFIDQYVAYQDHWLPDPRNKAGEKIDPLATIGVRYFRETYVPYWDPEMGFRLDGNAALGLPLFGEDQFSGLAWGTASWVTAPPEGLGWFSDVKLALRAYGGIGFPKNGRLFTLGGSMLFRGFDEAERQGSCMWVGSAELRLPVCPNLDWDFLDRMVRLENIYLAPFYDVGDIYANHHSVGPLANALGVGLRLDLSFFRFLERATLRFDVAQAIDANTGPQFWFGLQNAF